MLPEKRYFGYTELAWFERELYFSKVRKLLNPVSVSYPGFDIWYRNLFENDKSLHSGREIIFCEAGSHLAGVAILKSEEEEKKICTLYVAPTFQGYGIGKGLMELSLAWLGCDKPLITVGEGRSYLLSQFLSHYGFRLEGVQQGYYREQEAEFTYNGILDGK